MTDEESYQKKMEAQFNQLRAQITELLGKLEAGVDEQVEALRPKLKASLEKLDELTETSADAWGDLKPVPGKSVGGVTKIL